MTLRHSKAWAIGALAALLLVLFVLSRTTFATADEVVEPTAPALISGRVVDGDGNPLAQVKVLVGVEFPFDGGFQVVNLTDVVTDADGTFSTFANLPDTITSRNPDGSVDLALRVADDEIERYYTVGMMPPSDGAPWRWPTSLDLGVVEAAARAGLAPGDPADQLLLTLAPHQGLASDYSGAGVLEAP